MCGSLRKVSLGLDQLHIERDANVRADHNTSRFQRLIPDKSEIVTLDRSACVVPDALISPRIAAASRFFDVEDNLTRRPANRQIAKHAEVAVAKLLDLGTAKRHHRKI